MTLTSLFNNLDSIKTENKSSLIEELKLSLKSLRIKRFAKGDERPCDISDFAAEKIELETSINIFKLIIENLVNCGFFNQSDINSSHNKHGLNNPDIDNELLSFIFILCGENETLKPWNTETTVNNCNEILCITLKLFDCSDISQLISKDVKRNLVRDILQIVRPDLLATTWKFFPAAINFYVWFLAKIKQPMLSHHLPVLLPTALLLVDDFVPENKILGVKSIHHIVGNVTIAELQFHGHGDVIYNALMPLLRIREAELISYTIPCIIDLTSKLEIDFGTKDSTKWSKFDNILEIVLENMEMEQLIDLRLSYNSTLQQLIQASGLGIIRWTKRLLRIFREYLEIGGKHEDEKSVNYCLNAIQLYFNKSECVRDVYAKELFFILLIPLHSTCNSLSTIQQESKKITVALIKMVLQSISETDKNNIKKELKENLEENKFLSFYEIIYPFFEQ